MRNAILMILLVLGLGAPVFGQEAEKPEKSETEQPTGTDDKEGDKEDKEGTEEKAAEEDKQKMTAEGEKLYKDAERIYARYYEIILKKFKANEPYKTEDVWNDAVKAAKNAEYKDGEEFQKALQAMQRKDRVFKKKLRELMVKKAREYADAIAEDSKKD